MFNKNRFFSITVLVLAVAVGLSSFSLMATAQKKQTVEFGIIPWSESLAVGSLLTHLLEVEVGVNVNTNNPGAGAAYTAITQGDLDLFIEAWLPVTHQNYWEESAADLMDFGPIYEDAVLCWAVPNYIPEEDVNSVTDLDKEEVRDKMGEEIIGIDPGAGLMQASEEMMEEYEELEGWELRDSSDYAMVSELQRRMQRDNWVVVTLWKPHFAFAEYDIRCIDEPKNILGGEERIHMVGREDFVEAFPNEVSEFLSRFYLPIEKLNELTAMYEEEEDAAGPKFANKYPELVDYWINGMDALG